MPPGCRFPLVVVSVGFLSFSILTYEIELTRIFSVMLSNHYVFAIVSFALLGLGMGGMLFRAWRLWFPRAGAHTNAALFAVFIAGGVVTIINVPLAKSYALFDLGFWLYILLAAVPFFMVGLTMAEIFETFANRSSVLYGSDLAGAALGALAVVPMLNVFGAVPAALVTAAAAGVGATVLGWSMNGLPSVGFASMGVAFLGLFASSALGVIRDVPVARDINKDMYRLLKNPSDRAEIVESRWSAFGRTDLVRSEQTPDQMRIFIDGAAGSTLYNFDSLLENPSGTVHALHELGEYFPFMFLEENEKDNALIIGPGGGQDVVVALLGDVKSITAVEVNPDIVQLVKDYEDYSGGIYSSMPNVQVVVGEGRNYVRSSPTAYDLIMLSLPITKSSRSVEGFMLTENYLFTVEALGDYLDHLTPEGRIIIVAHDDVEIYRLVVLALKAFEQRRIGHADAMKHIYTIAPWALPTIVIKKEPFTRQQIEERHELIHKLGYDYGPFFLPYVRQEIVRPLENLSILLEWPMFDQNLVDISEEKLGLDDFVRSTALDITPVTDERPFFYKFQPGMPKPLGTFSLLIMLGVTGLTALVILPRNPVKGRHPFVNSLARFPRLKVFLIIFFSLGMAFMLIEIALFQKLTLFIGHPLLALTVLLFSLLLGSGVGSLSSSRVKSNLVGGVAVTSLAVGIVTVGYSQILSNVFRMGFDPRVTSALFLLPLGFVMGFPFPLSLRLMKQYGLENFIHVMWGVNGVASVLGSALAMILGVAGGFSYALYL
ncbi:MAG: hypothetical protein ACE5LH_08295, partial [Fidelibacterota bacterium]